MDGGCVLLVTMNGRPELLSEQMGMDVPNAQKRKIEKRGSEPSPLFYSIISLHLVACR